MKFRNFPESMLGSKVKVKVLMYMLADNMPTSERELSRIIGVSPMAVNKVMKEFHGLNLMSPLKIGNVVSWKLNEKSYAYESLADIRRMAKASPLQDLRERLKEGLAGRGIKRAEIFGSIAEGTEEANSDIDLLILVKGEKQKGVASLAAKALSQGLIQRYGNSLSPYILTEKEAKRPSNAAILGIADKAGIRII